MRALCLLLILSCLAACSPRPDYCGLNPHETTSWPVCAGAFVEFKGQRTPPERVQQHPVLAPPPGPLVAGEYNHQAYMDVGKGTQLILLTEDRLRCPDVLRVSGYLIHVSRGGTANTKNSYDGWAVRVLDYVCESW